MATIVLLTFAILSLVIFAIHRKVKHKFASLNNVPFLELSPGYIVHLVFVASVDQVASQILEWCSALRGEGVAVAWPLGCIPYVLLTSPAAVRALLKSRNLAKSREYDALAATFQGGLITVKDMSMWHRNRRLLSPAFSAPALRRYVNVFETHAKRIVERLRLTSEPIDIVDFLQRATFDIICSATLGRHFDALREPDQEFFRACVRIEEIAVQRMARPWLMNGILFRLFGRGREFYACRDVIQSLGERLIEERMVEAEASKRATDESPDNLLELLISLVKEGRMERGEIRQELDTFLSAGHETVTMALSWTLFLLGHRPDLQQSLREESRACLPDDQQHSLESLRQLELHERVVKESLRLYPPVPLVGRSVDADFEADGIRVPQGATATFSPYALHRDPSQWADPEAFRPERFLPEEAEGRDAFAFLPFSAGARNCIGQRFAMLEIKLLLSHLLMNFRVQSTQRRDEIQPRVELGLKPQPHIQLRFVPL